MAIEPEPGPQILPTTLPEVAVRLQEMGLVDARPLCEAILAGHNEAAGCTANDVATRPGYIRWSTALRHLGDFYVPRGFTRERPQNFEILVSPDRSYAITVAPGDDATGTDSMPSTRIDRGPLTGQAVGRNRYQLAFDPRVHPQFSERPLPEMQTWHLLWFCDEPSTIRCELSVPVEFTRRKSEQGRGFITRYEPRLILPTINLSADLTVSAVAADEPIDVPVHRR